MNKNYRDRIRAMANSRGVQYLAHFTPLANLPGIVTHGLMSRVQLLEGQHAAYVSAPNRIDDQYDAISVSVSRVNDRLFDLKRRASGHSDWVVLALDAAILWECECCFCWANAGTREIKGHRAFRGGPFAFDKMFAGSDTERNGLFQSFPTDLEAEVQVLETIAPSYILGATVDRQVWAEPVQAALNALPGSQRPVVVQSF